MSRRRARERWMKRMEAAGRRAAGRQCTLAVHSQCGRHVLSPPQRPQRQSRLSVGRLSAAPGSPTSGPLGWRWGLAGWGLGDGQGPACPSAAAQVWRLQNPLPPGVSTAGSGGEGWLWFLDVGASASDPREPAQPRPGTLSWRSVRKAKAKGRGVPVTTGGHRSCGLPGPPASPRSLVGPPWLPPAGCGRGSGCRAGGPGVPKDQEKKASRSCPHLRPQLAKGGEKKPPGKCRETFI